MHAKAMGATRDSYEMWNAERYYLKVSEGNQWELERFSPMDKIPTAVSLTTYSGGPEDFMATPLEELVKQIQEGKLKVKVGKVFKLEEIVEAHRCMEENRAGGKIVVLT